MNPRIELSDKLKGVLAYTGGIVAAVITLVICLIISKIVQQNDNNTTSQCPPSQRRLVVEEMKTMQDHNTIISSLKNKKCGVSRAFIIFYADWCVNCTVAKSVFDNVHSESMSESSMSESSTRRKSTAIFSRVNVDTFPELANLYNVDSVPLVVFRDDTRYNSVKRALRLDQNTGPDGLQQEMMELIEK